MIVFNYLFYLFILFFGLRIIFIKNNFEIVITMGLFSFFSTLQYIFFNANDVAITEASIGVCLSSILALKFLSQFHQKEIIERNLDQKPKKKKILKFFENIQDFFKKVLFFLFLILFLFSFYKIVNQNFSKFGEFDSKIYNESIFGYIQKTKNDIGIKNIVTAVLAFFRGYDTFVETLVILTAGIAVYFVLSESAKEKISKNEIQKEEMSKSFIIYRIAFFFIPFIILFALYLQIHGEESPGGGFQAGAIFACAFVLYALVISEDAVLNFFSIQNLLRLGAFGVLIYFCVGFFPIVLNVFSNFEFGLFEFKTLSNNLFLNYDHLLCSKNLLDISCLQSTKKLGIFLVELGVGICVFAITLSLFLNLKLISKIKNK